MADKKPSSKRGLWFKAGKVITGLTLLCFFLPFFGVSCEGMDVVTVSGADMVAGCKPGGLLAEAENQAGKSGMNEKGEKGLPKVPIEPLAIVALGLAVGAFALSFRRERKAMTGVAVCSVACIGALVGLWLKVGSDMKDIVGKELLKKNGGDEMGDVGDQMASKMTEKVDSGSRFGLYLVCFGMMTAAGITVLALKEPEGAENDPGTLPPAFSPPS